jgi:hypothetical protein
MQNNPIILGKHRFNKLISCLVLFCILWTPVDAFSISVLSAARNRLAPKHAGCVTAQEGGHSTTRCGIPSLCSHSTAVSLELTKTISRLTTASFRMRTQPRVQHINVESTSGNEFVDTFQSACRHGASMLAICIFLAGTIAIDPVHAQQQAGSTAAVSPNKAAVSPVSKDAEHQFLDEVLNTVEDHFLDLSNEKGVADSSRTKTFNGISWDDVRRQFDSTELQSRDDTYGVIRKLLKRLGDRFTRFMPPQEFAKLTKYDMTGVGVLLMEREGKIYLAAPPLSGSTGAEAGLRKGDQVLSIDGVDMTGRYAPPCAPPRPAPKSGITHRSSSRCRRCCSCGRRITHYRSLPAVRRPH